MKREHSPLKEFLNNFMRLFRPFKPIFMMKKESRLNPLQQFIEQAFWACETHLYIEDVDDEKREQTRVPTQAAAWPHPLLQGTARHLYNIHLYIGYSLYCIVILLTPTRRCQTTVYRIQFILYSYTLTRHCQSLVKGIVYTV